VTTWPAGARVFAIEASVDLGQDAAAQVDRLGERVDFSLQGVGAGGHCLGFQGLRWERHRHLAAEHRGHVVLEGEHVDQQDLPPTRERDDLPADIGVARPKRVRGVGGAKPSRTFDALAIDFEAIADMADARLVPIEPLEGAIFRIRTEQQPLALDDNQRVGSLSHGDADGLGAVGGER
jgi:hypothetical protein